MQATFSGIPGVFLDLSDLYVERFTYTYDLDLRFRKSCEPIHVIGADLAKGGASASPIVTSWHRGPEVWNDLNFLLLARPGFSLQGEELPPHAELLEISIEGSSTAIREAITRGDPIDQLVPKAVADLVRRAH